MPKDFEQIDICRVPLEHMREVIEAMAKYMEVRLERAEFFHGEPEYRFVELYPAKP